VEKLCKPCAGRLRTSLNFLLPYSPHLCRILARKPLPDTHPEEGEAEAQISGFLTTAGKGFNLLFHVISTAVEIAS